MINSSAATASPPAVPAAIPTAAEVQTAYFEELGPRERSALWAWIGFTATFVTVRGITYSIHAGDGPFHDVTVGRVHLHHYMWGIGMVSGIGAVAVAGSERARRHPLIGTTYGVALIVDEFALLLDLKDVYWAKQGRLSVDIGIALTALGGTLLTAVPIIGRLVRDRRRAPAAVAAPPRGDD